MGIHLPLAMVLNDSCKYLDKVDSEPREYIAGDTGKFAETCLNNDKVVGMLFIFLFYSQITDTQKKNNSYTHTHIHTTHTQTKKITDAFGLSEQFNFTNINFPSFDDKQIRIAFNFTV